MVDDGDGLDQDGRGHVRAADVEQDLGKGQLKVRYGSVQGVKQVIQLVSAHQVLLHPQQCLLLPGHQQGHYQTHQSP